MVSNPTSDSPPDFALQDSGELRPVVASIRVRGLFGKFSYDIPGLGGDRVAPGGRLLTLYGENGSGKTTILRLVYHLLSPSLGKGHRSFLARTPFESLQIVLRDGFDVTVHRDQSIGSFEVSVSSESKLMLSAKFETNEKGFVPLATDPETVASHRSYGDFLESLNLVPYYMADDRAIYSDSLETEDEDSDSFSSAVIEEVVRRHGVRKRHHEGKNDVGQALSLASERFRNSVFTANRSGFASANNIYLDVVRRLASYRAEESETSGGSADATRSALALKLSGLLDRNNAYEEFGLSAPFEGKELLKLLKQTPAGRVPLLNEVLAPYLEGLELRLEALRPTEQLLRTFVTTVNGFLSWKSLGFSLARGLAISTDQNDTLDPSALSSGERQLLLLLCNVVTARDDTRLFLIDEPEISLNVKWQRNLLDALLVLSAQSDMQFIVATHSVEMLARHQETLAQLISRP